MESDQRYGLLAITVAYNADLCNLVDAHLIHNGQIPKCWDLRITGNEDKVSLLLEQHPSRRHAARPANCDLQQRTL